MALTTPWNSPPTALRIDGSAPRRTALGEGGGDAGGEVGGDGGIAAVERGLKSASSKVNEADGGLATCTVSSSKVNEANDGLAICTVRSLAGALATGNGAIGSGGMSQAAPVSMMPDLTAPACLYLP